MLIRILTISALCLCCSIGHAEEKAVEIPLSEIWALDIPGAKDVRTLEDREKFRGMKVEDIIKKSLVENTKSFLNSRHRPPAGKVADSGFVVVGMGINALKETNAIMAKRKDRSESLPSGKELSLVFFSYDLSRTVYLDEISRDGKEITIKYHFHDDGVMLNKTHFALIPLGTLPQGKFNVKIERLPDTIKPGRENFASKSLDQEMARRFVCDSFDFQIEGK